MTRLHDPLDQLIREALGEPANPALARRACRAALRLVAADEQRRARRLLRGLTMAAGLALMFGLAGPLGSDDFDLKMEASYKNGHEIRKYERGVAGDVIGTYGPDDPRGFSEAEVQRMVQERAAGQHTLVELHGWQAGEEKYFFVVGDTWTDVKWSATNYAADGYSENFPRWFLDILKKMPTLFGRVDEIIEHRAPDFRSTMTSNGLEWDVKAWHLQLPGLPEIIYYFGLRADGVRGQ